MNRKNIFYTWLLGMVSFFIMQSCSEKEGSVHETPQLGKDKIKEVIAAMTPEEKIGLTVGDGKFIIARLKAENKNKEVPVANRNSKPVIPRLNIRTTASDSRCIRS